MLETTMHIHTSVDAPNSRSEALNGSELVPLRRLSVVDFECNIFSDLIGSSSDDHHEWSQKQCGMLVTWCWCFTCLVRCLDPVPAAITMTTEAPSVTQTCLVCGAPTEAHHHASGTTSLAKCSRVIDAGRWLLTTTIELVPTEGCALYAQAPHIIDWLCTGITAEYEQVRLRENN